MGGFLGGGDPQTLNELSNRELIATSSTGDWIGRPSVISDGTKWIVVYRAGTTHYYDSSARIHIRFSTDEGVTWTNENKFTNGSDVTGAPFAGLATMDIDTPFLVNCPNGNLLMIATEKEQTWTQSRNYQWRSTNAGASWTYEGIVGNEAFMDACVVGTEIYIAAYADAGGNEAKGTLWKSTDNGANWSKVSDVITPAGDVLSVDECSVCNPSGNTLVMMFRDRRRLQTYIRTSANLGATWGAVVNPSTQIGVIQRPRLEVDGSRIYMIGRKLITDTLCATAVSYSDNNGLDWVTPCQLEDEPLLDAAYADMIKRTDGNLYCLTYDGTSQTATIYEYIVDVLA